VGYRKGSPKLQPSRCRARPPRWDWSGSVGCNAMPAKWHPGGG